MEEKENIIDAIEDRLKMLEQEKNEIEKLYGFDENILKYVPTKINDYKTKTKVSGLTYDTNSLPKLEMPKKKEIKNLYKTPDSLKDSLRYEPNINDLWNEKIFEPSFANLNVLKTNPVIPKGSSVYNYLEGLNQDYVENYLN